MCLRGFHLSTTATLSHKSVSSYLRESTMSDDSNKASQTSANNSCEYVLLARESGTVKNSRISERRAGRAKMSAGTTGLRQYDTE